ncbi:unnamed protein product [Ilex paraguariensis]|uniref:Cation/H+ exchanger domain-containing protein n=1 Tax=Ilex paraguariensis TaxID=185542 RepID=A0ABC8S8J2_9AQUA
MDPSLIRKTGRRAMVIGISTFVMPLVLNLVLALILKKSLTMDPNLHKSLLWVASFQSNSSFHSIVCLLAELKLLNSELGRLAISSSMISGTCSWLWTTIVFTIKQSTEGKKEAVLLMFISVACLFIFVGFILQPMMLWMVRQTAHEKAVKESYVNAVFIMVLGCCLFGEILGQHFLFGPIILGMAVPDGPPLGSALINKLDCFVSSILLPLHFVFSGARIDLSLIHCRNVGIVEILALSAYLGKVIGTMLPSLYCKMPPADALCLGIIMSTQGIMDILILGGASQFQLIDQESYCIMVLSAAFFTGTISPIVKFLYQPSRRYIPYKRRTIQHARPNAELCMLACIYHQDHTPSIINLLQATNSSLQGPLFLYVVHLVELSGRAVPALIAHHPGRREPCQSDPIINAFRLYEKQNQGNVMVYPLTVISPYATVHDDVCALAADKMVSMVILPFHNLWTNHGAEGSNAVRAVNRNILRMAPCSVGILVDRYTMRYGSNRMLESKPFFTIGVIFLGGQDDREALAYASRMAKHPNVGLTVVRLVESGRQCRYSTDMDQDMEMIKEFRVDNINNARSDFQEEVVKDSVGLVTVIQKIENSFDLILVGRRHPSDSPLLMGLTEWNEYPELGFIADMLASSDATCKVPVLVVQQQSYVCEGMVDIPKHLNEDPSTVKVWPIS